MSEHPLVAIAYERWRDLPWKSVLEEMAVLFHLAVKIEEVKALNAEILETPTVAQACDEAHRKAGKSRDRT